MIGPPPLPPTTIERPSLRSALREATGRRLTIVVAGPGFGKTTLLGSLASEADVAWCTAAPGEQSLSALATALLDAVRVRVPGIDRDLLAPGSIKGPDAGRELVSRASTYASTICGELEQKLTGQLILVIDDLHEVGAGPATSELVAGLCRQAPPQLHVVISSRDPLPFSIERLRGQGQVLSLGAKELAFDLAETEGLLRLIAGDVGAEQAAAVHEATQGWPAAVRLAGEALRYGSEIGARSLGSRGGPVFAYLAEEVFAVVPPETEELLRVATALDAFTAELCKALGLAVDAHALKELVDQGLFLAAVPGEDGWYALTPLARGFLEDSKPLSAERLTALQSQAADWFDQNGYPARAVRMLATTGDGERLAALLERAGATLLAAGATDLLLTAAQGLPAPLRSAIQHLEGEAHFVRGDWEGALGCFSRVAGVDGPISSAIAWRMGLIYHQRGAFDDALAVYGRGIVDGSEPASEAILLAWTASIYWLRGEVDECAELADQAFGLAQQAGDHRALATAHTALALVAALRGDRAANDLQYVRALDHAEEAGDSLIAIRIRVNRGSHFLEEGFYEEAVAELDEAIRLADLTGFALFRALALSNRGEANAWLGRLDEAVADLDAARALYQRLGSRMLSYPLAPLGEVYRLRGHLALARAAFEEAIALAEPQADLQGLVPALAGLAVTLAAEDPELAEQLVSRAIASGPVLGHAAALAAGAKVALARGDHQVATERAVEAATIARARRDRPALADALETQALAGQPPRRDLLEESLALWKELRSPIAAARVELALARIGPRAEARVRARRAERRLRELGARLHANAASAFLAELDGAGDQRLAIHCLGGFRVVRDGVVVPATQWQSRKARDLVKILASRLGSRVPREYVMEVLWPDEDPARSGRRLSVALSTCRAVLDPDRDLPADHFIAADAASLWLNLDHVRLDVHTFLQDAEAAFRLRAEGRTDDAVELLAAAESVYVGDFLEEDPYEDWPVALRERARDAYVRTLHTLAADARATGESQAAVRYVLRVLERDPFDEAAHLRLVESLVASGRHGEARRAYGTYVRRMGELGVEAAPFPHGVEQAEQSA